MANPPHFNIDMAEFWQDPYPTLARMRAEAPIAYVPQLNGVVFTKRDDIVESEKNIEVFSSHQPEGLMNKLMGHNMMRKDGKAHTTERKIMLPAVSTKTVREHWLAEFQQLVDKLLDDLQPQGQADLFNAFAMPFSAECLKSITGLSNAQAEDFDNWSQGMIDGIANYIGDPEVEARCHAATAAIDAAIDDMLPIVTATPNHSLLSVMLQAGMPLENIRANIKLNISGGQNEPRDAIAGAIWALLTHPEQLRRVLAGEIAWSQVFEEYLRWISPIGMSPRRIAKPFTIYGIELQPDDRIFFMFSSANRDEDHFTDSDQFDITRDTSKHIAFGAGPHFCAGAWISKAMIADVALPTIFTRLTHLSLVKDEPVRLGGWAFRGVLNLPVTWQTV